MKFLVLPDYSNETTAQYFPVLLLIYVALSRTTASLRASSPFGKSWEVTREKHVKGDTIAKGEPCF